MKKRLLTLLVSAICISASFAQYEKDYHAPFFETANYQGAFAPAGNTQTKITLYGQTIKTSNGNDWVLASPGNWLQDWTNWDPQNTVYPGDQGYSGPAVSGGTKSGDIITDQTWGVDNQLTVITISGAIHVTNGATLTIKKNTIIRGDASNISFLLIAKGSKLYAIGTPDQPIIFTSNKAPGQRTSGDWAGFLLMGKSQNNTSPNGTGVRNFEALPTDPLSSYGGGTGFDIHDNSGECRFLRVEFAGYNYLPDQEINGVTFGAVGDGTRFDFCQVSFSRDDSYEWFGGTCNHKYLVAWAGIDDDFDQDEGYQGKLQFCLGVRKYDVFETSAGGTSHGFEHDNNTGLGTSSQNVVGMVNPQPSTRPRLCNITEVGPRIGTLPNISSNRFGAGMAFRTGDESCVYNSIIIGFPRQWELYHNSSSIVPSAHQKLIGKSDAANYVPNEVQNTILIKDKLDTRSGLGKGNGIMEQQQVPTSVTDPTLGGAYYDATTGLFNASGTLMDDNGIVSWLGVISGNGSTASKNNFSDYTNYQASDIFAAPYYWNGSAIVVPDFTLTTTFYNAHANTPSYSAPNLALNSLSGSSFYFLAAPSTLPEMITQPNVPSTPVIINVSSFGLTATGITLSSSSADFKLSVDGGVTWTATTLPTNSGSVWVSYVPSAVGSANGTITLTPLDTRSAAQTVNVSGLAVQPAVPFVMASQGVLANFSTNFLNTESSMQQFTITGNLLEAGVTVTAPSNFEISSDGTTFTSSLVYTPVFRQLTPKVVYVKYKPTISVSTTGGTDMAAITIASQDAITENVNVNGSWGFSLQVGPLDPADNSNLLQYISIPSLPSFISYTGVPSPSQVSYVKATGVPAGQSLVVHSLAGLQFSTDNVTFGTGPLLFTPDGNGNVPATPFYVRFIGSGSLGTYGTTGGNVIGIGLTGTTTYDKLMGLQGATVNAPAAISGTVVMVNGNVVSATGSTFTTKLVPGAALYLGGVGASNFVGIVSSVTDDFTVTVDRTVTSVATSLAATATNATMINVQSNNWESNKDFNRGALWFPTGTLNAAGTAFNVASQLPGVITVSGYSPLAAFVGRDYSTEYALRYEVSLDNTNWTDIVSIAGTNGVIAPTVVYVRYNPTGTNVSGHVAGNPVAVTIPGFGQHTGSILVGSSANTALLSTYTGNGALSGRVMTGGVILYTVGYSDPILYASSTKLPSYPGILDVNSGLADLRTIANTPSLGVPVYVFGTRLQSDITVSSPSANFELSADGVSNWTSSLTLSKDASSNYVGTYYVRFNPLNSSDTKVSNISVATTKTSADVSVHGIPVPVPTSYIQSSDAVLDIPFNGSKMITLAGNNLVSNITVTSPLGFQISNGSAYSSSLVLVPNTLNYGTLTGTTITVSFTGLTSLSGILKASAMSATDVNVTLTGGGVVTGITQALSDETKLTLYPNPSNGDVTIALGLSKEDVVSGVIYDYTGSIVKSFTTTMSPEVSTYQVSGLTPGFYGVSISTSTGRKTVKLVVQ